MYVGYYTAIAPLYLKVIASKELRKILGRFFSFGKIIGVDSHYLGVDI
jgi:hypothetical protein